MRVDVRRVQRDDDDLRFDEDQLRVDIRWVRFDKDDLRFDGFGWTRISFDSTTVMCEWTMIDGFGSTTMIQ